MHSICQNNIFLNKKIGKVCHKITWHSAGLVMLDSSMMMLARFMLQNSDTNPLHSPPYNMGFEPRNLVT